MQIIKQEDLNIIELVEELKSGKTLVYPTETVYGLGCDATNQSAVDQIFAIKKRQSDKSMLIIASDPSMMMEYIDWTPKLQEIYDKYWPGPLTVVVPAKIDCNLAKGVLAIDGTIAFRISGYSLAYELSHQLGRPIVSTSANLAQEKSPYDIEDVLAMFENEEIQPDIIIDSDKLPERSSSTIIKIQGDEIIILRQGEININ